MVRVRELNWYPAYHSQRFGPENCWLDSPTVDRFAFEATVDAAAAYGKHLRIAQLPPGTPSYLRIFVRDGEYGPPYIPSIEPGDDMVVMDVAVDTSILDRDEGRDRTEAALMWIHRSVLELATAHGWQTAQLDAVLARARAELKLPGGDRKAVPIVEPIEERHPSAEFWDWIALLRGGLTQDSVAGLAEALTSAGTKAIADFDVDLGLALAELDTTKHRKVRVTDSSSGVVKISMGDDVFLYARLSVIVLGREEWSRVVAHPSALAEDRRIFDGEQLSLVVPLAREEY